MQVDRNLNVSGNITIGGTSATIFSQTLNIYDPDIILGFRTDEFGNDVSTDNTANHGGVSIASTEGNPLVQLFIAGIETNPATYKKIMWFKAGTFSGLGTDAWLSNYAVGIGSTQFPTGTRLAVGNVQFNQSDLAVVRNINASGVITATSGFSGNASSATYATSSGVSTSVIGGIGSITQLQVTGISTFTNGPVIIGSATSTGTASQPLQVTGGAYVSGNAGIGTTNPTEKLHVVGNVLVSGVITATTFSGTLSGYATSAGIATYATNAGIATYATTAGIATISQGLTGTPNISVGIVTATSGNFSGIITSSGANITGVSTLTQISAGGNTGSNGQVLQSTGTGLVWATPSSGGSSDLVGLSTLGFFGDDQNITSSVTLPANKTLYTVHKNINVATGSTITVGSGSTIIMDRFNNLDNVVATSFKGDGSKLTGIPVGDLYELDQINPAGGENTYTPTFNYETVAVSDPFRLLITVDGIMQSAYVHNTEYVFNNSLLVSRSGYTIDYDGKIKFTEALAEGSEVMIKTTAGTTKSTTRRYPFTALDILF